MSTSSVLMSCVMPPCKKSCLALIASPMTSGEWKVTVTDELARYEDLIADAA